MAGIYDYSPTGYKEWFVNSSKYRFGTTDRPVMVPAERVNDALAVTVLEAQIPYTFYTISANNNRLFVQVRDAQNTPTDMSGCIQIAPGNYTTTTIGDAILLALSTAFPAFTGSWVNPQKNDVQAVSYPAYPGWGRASTCLGISYNETTSKLSFSIVAGTDVRVTFFPYQLDEFNYAWPFQGTCLTPLGFELRPSSYASYTIAQAGNSGGFPSSFSPPNAISLGGPTFLMIRSTLSMGAGDNVITSEGDIDATASGNILAAIPVNAVPGGTIMWKNLAPRGGFFNLTSATLSEITFWVTTGDDDQPIQFNGRPFQLKLAFISRNRGNVGSGSMYSSDRVSSWSLA